MLKRLLGLLFFALLLGMLLTFGRPIWGTNFGPVVPDRAYRSGQLSPDELEERIERYGIRSIVNLRGDKADRAWYRDEVEIARRRGVVFKSIDLVPERLPSRLAVVDLIEFLETLPEPILIHCAAGADRTGFASVITKMAKGAASLAEARKELSVWWGHIPFGPSSEIGRIFDQYETHLRQSRDADDWTSFRRWAREVYVPYVYSVRLEVQGFPSRVGIGERMDVRVRITNTSPGPWTFTNDEAQGIKLGVRIRREGKGWVDYDRHAPVDGTMGAGEELELEVSIWAPREPGRYQVKLDMVDEHVTWFEDQGSRALVRELVVVDEGRVGQSNRSLTTERCASILSRSSRLAGPANPGMSSSRLTPSCQLSSGTATGTRQSPG